MTCRNYFVVLIAGGGTGDITMHLAEQLRYYNAEILYLDFSSQSSRICQERARLRKLENVIFIRGWIESINKLGLYNFDYIQSSGVLHHLKYPLQGLKNLKTTLRALGGLSLMVYGSAGRIPIYQIQNLFKILRSKQLSLKQEVENAKSSLSILPNSNWQRKMYGEKELEDEGELYDRYLHRRDISFSSIQIVQFVSDSGLHFVDYTPNTEENHILFKYQDKFQKIKLGTRHENGQKYHIQELLTSSLKRHNIYISNNLNSIASVDNTDNIIYIHGNPIGFRDTIIRSTKHHNHMTFWYNQFIAPSKLNIDSRKYTSVDLEVNGGAFKKISIPYTDVTLKMLYHLIKSSQSMNTGHTVKQMGELVFGYTNDSVSFHDRYSQLNDLLTSFQHIGVIVIRSQDVDRHPASSALSYYMFKPKLR